MYAKRNTIKFLLNNVGEYAKIMLIIMLIKIRTKVILCYVSLEIPSIHITKNEIIAVNLRKGLNCDYQHNFLTTIHQDEGNIINVRCGIHFECYVHMKVRKKL